MLDDRLHALALTDLPGINVRMEVRLKARGVPVAAFALIAQQARAVWGAWAGSVCGTAYMVTIYRTRLRKSGWLGTAMFLIWRIALQILRKYGTPITQ